ncbi:MAG TPA: choice-of-anchor Q domain-containing protein, partial [Bacteroidales bacterium]|nr:choice-of-anchor Q domain-containing protein [Bacteroidales bacterium]
QDVHIFRETTLNESTTWTADKPYLIIDYVIVDTLQTLTIEPGAKIYMHRDAGIFVVGTLEMNGTIDDPIVVQGDRLESFYDDLPGQWLGIYFAPGSMNNVINYAEIYNGTFGLRADSVVSFDQPVLKISNTEINRMAYGGILGRGTTIEAYNTVVGDCGNSCVEMLYEGSYEFTHCTFANYWNDGFSNRKTPALLISNYFAYQDSLGEVIIETRDIEKAVIRNSIIYGNSTNEIEIRNSDAGLLNYTIDRCITRFDEEEFSYQFDPNFIGIFNNVNPKFDSIKYSYELDPSSPAINQGNSEYAIDFPYDKKGDSRVSDKSPDLGAFEWMHD